MARLKVNNGDKYGKLTILGEAESTFRPDARSNRKPREDRRMQVRCDCGIEKVVRLADLRSGNTWHCGCQYGIGSPWVEEDRGYITACHIFQGHKHKKGYGAIWNGTKEVKAHNHFYELTMGPVPNGLILDHLCRVPECCNPEHLEPVTNAENTRRGNSTKLSRSQVDEIKARATAGENQRRLADEFGIVQSTVSAIKTGRLWVAE